MSNLLLALRFLHCIGACSYGQMLKYTISWCESSTLRQRSALSPEWVATVYYSQSSLVQKGGPLEPIVRYTRSLLAAYMQGLPHNMRDIPPLGMWSSENGPLTGNPGRKSSTGPGISSMQKLGQCCRHLLEASESSQMAYQDRGLLTIQHAILGRGF